MLFPKKKYARIDLFCKDYSIEFLKSYESINLNDLNKVYKILLSSFKKNKNIFVCGNGGSAALSDHFACDHQKIIFNNTPLKPRITSLNSNNPLITAIANDNNYSKIFSDQLNMLAKKGDLLLVITCSGNSLNIVEALKMAKKKNLKTISLTGFDGGFTKKNSNLNLHVDSYNYGVIENIHHSIMNILSQFIRQKYTDFKKKIIF